MSTTREQSRSVGKTARDRVPLDRHGEYSPGEDRDPIGLLLAQAESRIPELVPVRHGRMLLSPFTFFRGAALPMAADLSTTPTSGLRVQLCGDAHLSNFGLFGSPERRVIFDVNDFDETLPGPFEWDVKRLVASLVVAGRENGLSGKQRRDVALATVSTYRTAMRDFARQSILDVWYARLDVEDAIARYGSQVDKRAVRLSASALTKARTRDSTQAVAKLTTLVDGRRRIVSDPPLIVPVEDVYSDRKVDDLYAEIGAMVDEYRSCLAADRRQLLDRFELTGVARKVVGVGSVGTQAWILLMESSDGGDPLMLQSKQAQTSVLAAYAGPSEYEHHGERVAVGQRLMQGASDIFLGSHRISPSDGPPVDYYIRQLKDWKYSASIEQMTAESMGWYGGVCGWTLARAHARTGDRIAISAYLGKFDRFDQALVEFGEAYADQTERDHVALQQAVTDGRAQARLDL